jgi:hypothetical protein
MHQPGSSDSQSVFPEQGFPTTLSGGGPVGSSPPGSGVTVSLSGVGGMFESFVVASSVGVALLPQPSAHSKAIAPMMVIESLKR